MIESSDETIKRWFPNNLARLGAIILCVGIGIGFGGNKLFSYLVDSSTNLDFVRINAKIDVMSTRITEDEEQIKDISVVKNKVDVIDQKLTDIKEQIDNLQKSFSYEYHAPDNNRSRNYSGRNPQSY